MGIRFACPNGHPLHVKAELAGKRGICPECQVRFVIPQPAGQTQPAPQPQAAAPTPTAAKPAPAPQPAAPPTASKVSPAAPTPSQSAAAGGVPSKSADASVSSPTTAASTAAPTTPPAEQPMWYVRPASGGQFGPADDALVHQWAGEGRLASDSYVWRTGWPDWRLASELPEHFPQLAARPGTAAMPSANDYNGAQASGGTSSPDAADVSLATARYRRRKMRTKRIQQLAAAVLILLTIILSGVLIWVLVSTSGTPDADETGGPSTTQMPVVTPDTTEAEDADVDQEDGAMDDPEAMDASQP